MKKAIIASVAAFAIVGSSYFAINQFVNMGIGMDKIIATPIVNDSSKVSDKYKVRVESKPTNNIETQEQSRIINESSTVGVPVSSRELNSVQEKISIPYNKEINVKKENKNNQEQYDEKNDEKAVNSNN